MLALAIIVQKKNGRNSGSRYDQTTKCKKSGQTPNYWTLHLLLGK